MIWAAIFNTVSAEIGLTITRKINELGTMHVYFVCLELGQPVNSYEIATKQSFVINSVSCRR